jgi:hypothetical protein|tara:strand:- start:684 stop:881 length:198 start_codon:yes stop_codon:yes gene_type:complete
MWYDRIWTTEDIRNPRKIKDMISLVNRSNNLLDHETKSDKVKLKGLRKMIVDMEKAIADLQGLPF